MSRHPRERKGAARIERTQAVIRGYRLAMWRMARAKRRDLPCIAELERVLAVGATAEQLEHAATELACFADPQQRLI